MRLVHGLLHRLRVLLSPTSYAREVEQEIRFHLELEAMHRRNAGHSNADANAIARRQFGNVTYTREEVRRMSGMHRVDRLRQNIAYAVRGLRRSPGFTLGVALTLGLGLGVNAAMFDFLDRVFVRPPSGVFKPNQVRRLYTQSQQNGEQGALEVFRYPMIRGMLGATDTSVALGIFTLSKDTTSVRTETRLMLAQRALANAAFFKALGVRLALGRVFDATEDRIDMRLPVAIISYAMWQRLFDGSPGAVGSVIRIAETPVTVIGVLDKDFSGIQLDRVDYWMPAGNFGDGAPQQVPWYNKYQNEFGVITRLSNAAAEGRFLEVASRAYREVIAVDYAGDPAVKTTKVLAAPLLSALGPAKSSNEVSIAVRLGGVSLLVLLIALANVSNLLLVRASERAREIAVRRALGAGRGRLFEQFLTESVLLALVSLLVTVSLAILVGAALRSVLLPNTIWSTGPLDVRTLSLAVGATLIVGIVIGLAPALSVWRPDLISSLRAGSAGRGYRRSRVSQSFVVVQAALSVILLVGAGLFVRSLQRVHDIDIGYDVQQTVFITPLSERAGPLKSLDALMPELLRRLAAIPGVEAVASVSGTPMMSGSFSMFKIPGRDKLPDVGGKPPSFFDVTPEFFSAAGIRVIAGRTFSDNDRSGVVVGEALAKAFWPDVSPLGQCVVVDEKTRDCTPVIGVVEDVHRFRLIEKERLAQYYVSMGAPHRVAVIRVSPERQSAIIARMDEEVRAIVPEARIVRTRSLASALDSQFRPWRLGAILFSAMGLLALVVAAIGVYSVVANVVSQRTNEFGIRIALGAQLSDITRLIVGGELRTVAVGIAAGVLLSLALVKLIESTLYGVSPRDPLVIGGAALVLTMIAVVASVIPSLRAARVSPTEALRAD